MEVHFYYALVIFKEHCLYVMGHSKELPTSFLQIPICAATRTGAQFEYFVLFAKVVASLSCTQLLRKLAPTLCTFIYLVQADTTIGKSGALVQLAVTDLAKRRK